MSREAEEGVSPVVGQILVIVLVVVMVGVVAAFAMGLGAPAKPIIASIRVDASVGENTVTIVHGGGATIASAFDPPFRTAGFKPPKRISRAAFWRMLTRQAAREMSCLTLFLKA